MQGCFLDTATLGPDLDWSRLEAGVDHWHWYTQSRADQALERIGDARVVITNKVVLDAETLAGAEQLALICVSATGVNNIDIEAARERGIAVCRVAGYATPAVSQHVLALMLARATRWPAYAEAVAAGEWAASELFCLHVAPIVELAGKTLGIVGYGELGQAVATLGEAFGMNCLIAERPRAEQVREGRRPLAEVLAESDFLSLHCPLTEATRHLIDADALAAMKPDAYLINTARGAIVDAPALAAALKNGEIGGAAIDVLDAEPPPADHALLAGDIPNLIVTPHSAWASHGARQRLLDAVAANIEAFKAGERLNRVD